MERCICAARVVSLCALPTRTKHSHGATPECLTRRFWRFVRKTRTCWWWTGPTDEKGYGRIRLAGTRERVFVHRLAMLIIRGDMLVDELVCHKCNNPLCVRPDKRHAYVGSYLTNNRDTVESGRHNHEWLTQYNRRRQAA